MNKKRVLVAMSGGVDSSVALMKILEDGYEAIGVTMKLWELEGHESNCCSIDAINNAKLVCQSLGVPHYTLDFQEAFRENVVDYLVKEYFAGRTPNPCIQCNVHLRWGALLKQANLLSAYWIATGHYVRIDRTVPENPILKKGVDGKKDQSYVLWGISLEALKRTLLPLGTLTKREVRSLATEANLVSRDAPESQELCFVPDNDYRGFLQQYAPGKSSGEQTGDFISEEGQPVSKHRGISRYTIGQRRGLGVTGPEAVYVKKIDPDTKKITLAPRRNMFFDGCRVENLNWIMNPAKWKNGNSVYVQIRYNHVGVPCELTENGDGAVTAEFESPQFAVTPGQSAVFYTGDQLLGGGIITEGLFDE